MCWLRSKEHGQAREAGTPHANPPAFCLFLEGLGSWDPSHQPSSLLSVSGRPGDTREHGLPRNKGADEGPGRARGVLHRDQLRTGPADRQGAGSRPQRHARSGESWRQGRSRAAGSPQDTLTPLATRLWAGGPVLESLSRRLSCPPQGDSSQSSCHRALLYWGLLDGQAFIHRGLLYWGLLDGRGFPLWGASSTGHERRAIFN